MKHSKSLLKLQNDTKETCRHAQPLQPSNDNEKSDRDKMIERRKQQVSGVELCSCGGVIWNLGNRRRCGDCQCEN